MSDDKKDTCIGESCPFYKIVDGKQTCPNHMETVWVNENSSTPMILNDCAPKRSVFMMMEMYNHLMGSKKYACETRNMLRRLDDATREFMTVQDGHNGRISDNMRRVESKQEKIIENQDINKVKYAIPTIPDLRL